MTEQNQSGGMGSTNTQIAHVSIGMSYSDVRDIATDVFNANFLALKGEANDTSELRRAELVDAIIDRLKNENIHELAGFAHPEKQIALFEAQKAFALSGDSVLKSMLVDTIAKLAQEPERSLKSIVLQEAIKTMPSLTPRQVSVLAVSFLIRSVAFNGAGTLGIYFQKIKEGLGETASTLEASDGDFRHLEFTRCGVVELGDISLQEVLRRTYPGIVSAGVADEVVQAKFSDVGVPNNGIMPSLWGSGKYQIAAVNEHVLDIKSNHYNWTAEQKSAALELLTSSPLDDETLKNAICGISDFASRLYHFWADTNLSSLKLSSVGIAVAHTFCVSNGLDLADLDVWI